MFANLVIVLVTAQTVLIPILGCMWLGMRAERKRKEQMLMIAIKNLNIRNLHRGRR